MRQHAFYCRHEGDRGCKNTCTREGGQCRPCADADRPKAVRPLCACGQKKSPKATVCARCYHTGRTQAGWAARGYRRIVADPIVPCPTCPGGKTRQAAVCRACRQHAQLARWQAQRHICRTCPNFVTRQARQCPACSGRARADRRRLARALILQHD